MSEPNPTFYGAASTRNAARDRLVSGFPLPEVNMTAPVGPLDFTEKASWPPTRVKNRIDRLNLYEDMWRGDVTRFVKDETAANLVMNYFERVPTVIAALLLSKDPGVPDDQMVPVQRMLAEASVNGLRSGRAYITQVNGETESPETSKVYDGANGEIYVLETSTTVNSQSDSDNTLTVTAITSDGGSLKYTYEWSGGTIQGLTLGPEIGSGAWRLIDRPPRYNGWGRSLYDSLGPPLVGLALRLSGNERVIEKNLHPLTLMPLALADFSAFGSEGSPADHTSRDDVDLAAFWVAFTNALDEDLFLVPDSTSAPSKLEWGGTAMAAAVEMIRDLRKEVSAMTGLPVEVLDGTFEAVSGVALDRVLLALFATTRMWHRQLHAAAQELIGPFEWENAFEASNDTPDMISVDQRGQPITPAMPEVPADA